LQHRAILLCLATSLLLSSAAIAQRDAARPLPQDVGAEPGHLPKVHYVPSDTWRASPIWIDASLVLNRDGSINTALIPKDEATFSLKPLLSSPLEHGCVPTGAILQDIANAPDRRSVEEATRNSRLVILGRVTEKAYGVEVYIPGQLLRVVPEKILKGQPRNVPAYFVFMPVGNFKIGSVPICAQDNRYPDPPRVGDQVLLFVPDGANWEAKQGEPFLEMLDDGGIVTVHADSTVSLPARFGIATGSSVKAEDVLARVRAATVQGSH
jgi:hypothetical protein